MAFNRLTFILLGLIAYSERILYTAYWMLIKFILMVCISLRGGGVCISLTRTGPNSLVHRKWQHRKIKGTTVSHEIEMLMITHTNILFVWNEHEFLMIAKHKWNRCKCDNITEIGHGKKYFYATAPWGPSLKPTNITAISRPKTHEHHDNMVPKV